jgi:hypothetical protein
LVRSSHVALSTSAAVGSAEEEEEGEEAMAAAASSVSEPGSALRGREAEVVVESSAAAHRAQPTERSHGAALRVTSVGAGRGVEHRLRACLEQHRARCSPPSSRPWLAQHGVTSSSRCTQRSLVLPALCALAIPTSSRLRALLPTALLRRPGLLLAATGRRGTLPLAAPAAAGMSASTRATKRSAAAGESSAEDEPIQLVASRAKKLKSAAAKPAAAMPAADAPAGSAKPAPSLRKCEFQVLMLCSACTADSAHVRQWRPSSRRALRQARPPRRQEAPPAAAPHA